MRELCHTSLLVNYAIGKANLCHLALPDFLFYTAFDHESIDPTMSFLSITVYSSHCLHIRSRVPVDVKEDESTGTDKIQARPSGFGGKKKCKTVFRGSAIEVIHERLAL